MKVKKIIPLFTALNLLFANPLISNATAISGTTQEIYNTKIELQENIDKKKNTIKNTFYKDYKHIKKIDDLIKKIEIKLQNKNSDDKYNYLNKILKKVNDKIIYLSTKDSTKAKRLGNIFSYLYLKIKLIKLNEFEIINLKNNTTQINKINKEKTENEKELKLFVMGYCPFGESALKKIPTLKKNFGDNINIDIHYIAKKKGNGYKPEDFKSVHGASEVEEDIRQLCVKKYYGFDNLLKYITKRYENANNYGQVTDDPKLAIETFSGDIEKINTCITSDEGGKLLAEDIKNAKQFGITASPKWLANNKYIFGGTKLKNIQAKICKYNKDLEGCKINTITTSSKEEAPSCESN